MSNHYFIGIGGTGGNVVKELRKAEYLREKEIKACGKNLKLGFLYVDSNDLELNHCRHLWQVLGTSVELPPANRLLIKSGNIGEALRNVGERPNISKWIGDPSEVSKLLGAEGGVPGAQQRRRFGRFLFATHIPEFRGKVTTKVAEMQKGGKADCTFHLIGTLAGGTGSGALVDAALQLRSRYHDSNIYKIILYVLITDDDGGSADAGYFYENQYAALKDINAVMVGKSRLHDLNSPLGDIFEKDRKLDQPIHRCVLVSNRNQHRLVLTKDKQEKILADWLMQIAIAEAQGSVAESNAGLGVDFQKALTSEDISPNYPAEPSSNYLRTYRFGAAGILRWAAPQPLIRERLGCIVAQQIGNQILFNHLNRNTDEYLDRSSETNVSQFRSAHSLKDLKLSSDHLLNPEQLAKEKGGATTNWTAHWKKKVQGDVAQFLNKGEEAIAGVSGKAETYYQRGYQGIGVENYFNQLHSDFTEKNNAQEPSIAESLVNSIEVILRNAFNDGQLGLQDVYSVIDSILDELKDQRTRFRKEREADSDQIEKLSEVIEKRSASDWSKIGPLSKLLGKQKSLLQGFGNKVAGYYSLRSRCVQHAYLEGVIDAVRSGLSGLQRAVEDVIRTLESVQAGLKQEATKIERQLHEPQELTKIEVDREKLGNMERELKRAFAHIDPAAKKARDRLFKDESFFARQRITAAGLLDDLVKDCDNTVKVAHDDLVQDVRKGLDPVIGVNLLEILYRKHGGAMTEDLKQEIERFISDAVAALQIDNAATQPRMILGGDAPSMPAGRLLIQVPARPAIGDGAENDRMAEFEGALRQSLAEAIQGDVPISLAESTDPTEITAVAVVSWMAARFATAVSGLKEKYMATMEKAGDQRNARYFCHLADDAFESLPDLFPTDTDIVRKEAGAIVKLGIMCGVVKKHDDGRVFLLKNHGDDPEILADNLKDYLNGSNSVLEGTTEDIKAELAKVPVEERDAAWREADEKLKAWAREEEDRNISDEYLEGKEELNRFRVLLDQL